MKIAYLAWGSLLWNDKNLNLKTKWEKTSFNLPLNFSRISDNGKGRLTLVVDQNGYENPVYFAIAKTNDLNIALTKLKNREKTTKSNVGYINLTKDSYRSTLLTIEQLQKIKLFAEKNNIDSVIWTDIPPNFQEIMGKPFSKNGALLYIDNKRNDKKMYNKILEYIFLSKIYGKIKTPLSDEVIKKLVCNL